MLRDWPIQVPFVVETGKEAKKFADRFLKENRFSPERTVVIQPCTSSGNERGFEPERHWAKERWQALVDLLRENNFSIVQIGGSSDNFPLEGTADLTGKTSILEAIALIEEARFCIGINSWAWEVAAYALHPTVVLYFHNHHWIPLHVGEGMKNLTIFKEKQVLAETVFKELIFKKGE